MSRHRVLVVLTVLGYAVVLVIGISEYVHRINIRRPQ